MELARYNYARAERAVTINYLNVSMTRYGQKSIANNFPMEERRWWLFMDKIFIISIFYSLYILEKKTDIHILEF
jgi:hypothetical protein